MERLRFWANKMVGKPTIETISTDQLHIIAGEIGNKTLSIQNMPGETFRIRTWTSRGKLRTEWKKLKYEPMQLTLPDFPDPSDTDTPIKIATASSRIHNLISCLLPRWFIQAFDESLIDDMFSFAKEEGGKIWWLKLVIVASQFVVKFAWRRFGQRKPTERAGSLPKGRDDEL